MNNRAWITGLALAGVAGTSGAAFAGMSAAHEQIALPAELVTASSDSSVPTSSSTAPVESTVTYQVGPAGSVGITRSGDVLTVTSTTAGEGWTVLGASVPGSHVSVQFADSLQVVTFTADVMGDDVAVMVENLPVGTVPVVTIPVVGNVPAPAPATPVIAQPAPGSTTPSAASTTAPSGGGDDDESDDDESEDDEDDESEDDEDDDDEYDDDEYEYEDGDDD